MIWLSIECVVQVAIFQLKMIQFNVNQKICEYYEHEYGSFGQSSREKNPFWMLRECNIFLVYTVKRLLQSWSSCEWHMYAKYDV